MFVHRHNPAGTTPVATNALHPSAAAQSGGAHPHLRAECPQLHDKSHYRFDLPA